MRTKCFLDAEFTGLRPDTSLISLAIKGEDGRRFYAEFTDYKEEQLNDWLNEHVMSNLILKAMPRWYDSNDDNDRRVKGCQLHVARALREWLKHYDAVEIWTDLGYYDGVLLHGLFGDAHLFGKLNPNVYYIFFDLSTRLYERGIDPDISREEFSGVGEAGNAYKHNAMWDADVIEKCWNRSAMPTKE